MSAIVSSPVGAVGIIVAAMAAVALLELALPLHARGRWHRAHLGPNLALTAMTFATNAVMNGALVVALVGLESSRQGLLRALALPPLLAAVIAVVGLDFAFYVAHVAMHHLPSLWRFHRVHHADPAVDVTTTIRQHPVEGVIRHAFMAALALPLGVSPGAFAVYRLWSALNGLLEHANLRAPLWLDRALSLFTTWPYMHKIHHSRRVHETDTNYGNILSLFDRLFGTFTPSARGRDIAYGLAGLDDPALQTTAALLAMPFRPAPPAASARGEQATG